MTEPILDVKKTGKAESIQSNSAEVRKSSRHTLIQNIQNKINRNPPTLYRPHSVTFLSNNDLAMAEGFWPYSRVQIFSSKNLYRTSFSVGQGEVLPYAVTRCHSSSNSHLAITDHRDRTVKFIQLTAGKRSSGCVVNSWKVNMFEWPTGIATDEAGLYYVADWSKGLVGVYDYNGAEIRIIKTGDEKNGSCPMDVCVDSLNRVIISDAYDQRVKVFSPQGQLLFTIGGDAGRGRAVDPRGVCIDERGDQAGRILVADWGDKAVKMYDSNGRYIEDVVTDADGVLNPFGISVCKEGRLAVVEHRLRVPPTVKVYQLE